MTNEQIIAGFLQTVYSDEKLAALLATRKTANSHGIPAAACAGYLPQTTLYAE